MPTHHTTVLPDAPTVGIIRNPKYGRREDRACYQYSHTMPVAGIGLKADLNTRLDHVAARKEDVISASYSGHGFGTRTNKDTNMRPKQRTQIGKAIGHLAVLLGFVMIAGYANASPIIKISNKDTKNPRKMSDLIAYKLNPFESHVFVKPDTMAGGNADDVTFQKGETKIYVAPFEPDFVFVSYKNEDGSELEAKAEHFRLGDPEGRKLAFVEPAIGD
ncbi:MAG: hypothetical protein GY842_21535, partial [bacterium]|nr:hypothetical protein [bacterium]